MIPRIIYFLLSCCVFFITMFSCSNRPGKYVDEQQPVMNKEEYYGRISDFMDVYSHNEMIKYHRAKETYAIEDSLCLYFSRLNLKEVIGDSNFKFLAGRFLETQYLEVRKSGGINPESFPVYNVSIWAQSLLSHNFALNIVTDYRHNIDSGFVKYADTAREFVCIDSVIFSLDRLPEMQNDSIHMICKELREANRTGGCKW